VLEVIEPGTLGGYDIGCAFLSTIQRSSLAPLFSEKNGSFCVCAFHGYSHCHPCQMRFHPNNIAGAGLEDLETMERIFSASNQLASVTRYSSPYRRRLFIEAYFRQWDKDKTANTGVFILNNYKQALEILEHDGRVYREAVNALGITPADLDAWEEEEASFFAHAGEEDKYDIHAVVYVEMLRELAECDSQRAQASKRFLRYDPAPSDSSYQQEQSSTRRIETERRHAIERHERLNRDICALEVEMGLTQRWTTSTPQYMASLKYIKERDYHRALNKLQKLVTQRLFELHKLNVAQTGKPRYTHKQPANMEILCLQVTRCAHIYPSHFKRAVRRYNERSKPTIQPQLHLTPRALLSTGRKSQASTFSRSSHSYKTHATIFERRHGANQYIARL
jgi:hypothetical protein